MLPHSTTRATASGLSPDTIKSVYNFPNARTAGSGQTVAIVDAYDDPSAESDLGVFSSQFGLPSCTTANGCFTRVNQQGGTKCPRTDSGWALEISLDVQRVHAIAPGAKIPLVEAQSSNFSDLTKAESYANSHAKYVSNSWGGSEFSGEAGWSKGGGGCSAYEPANSAQSDFSGCAQANCAGHRATPDVSLDADPQSGVSVHDSTRYQGQAGWWVVGGTSASTPMWAARSAITGGAVNAALVYGNSITFRDITSGNNGASCLVGFDLCAGRGSWTGTTP